MQDKNKIKARLLRREREEIFLMWRRGYTFAEIAQKFGMYRQKPRAVVLSFQPTFEDYRRHDHFRRLNQFKSHRARR